MAKYHVNETTRASKQVQVLFCDGNDPFSLPVAIS